MKIREFGKYKKLLEFDGVTNKVLCYDSRLKVLSQETTLVLSNTRELDRVPSTE